MQLERIILSEVRKRKTNNTRCHIMQNLNYDTNKPTYDTETRLRDRTDWELLTGWGKWRGRPGQQAQPSRGGRANHRALPSTTETVSVS